MFDFFFLSLVPALDFIWLGRFARIDTFSIRFQLMASPDRVKSQALGFGVIWQINPYSVSENLVWNSILRVLVTHLRASCSLSNSEFHTYTHATRARDRERKNLFKRTLWNANACNKSNFDFAMWRKCSGKKELQGRFISLGILRILFMRWQKLCSFRAYIIY